MTFKRISAFFIALCAVILFSQYAVASEAPRKENAPAAEPSLRPVQIFDIAAGKVVKTVPNSKKIQKFAASWIGSITGLAPQIKNDASCSYVYRVPLAKAVTIESDQISVTANDLFLFYCKEKPPVLLVFDQQRKPFLFLFKADITPFVKKMGIPKL